jgi:hypothetical protein
MNRKMQEASTHAASCASVFLPIYAGCVVLYAVALFYIIVLCALACNPHRSHVLQC